MKRPAPAGLTGRARDQRRRWLATVLGGLILCAAACRGGAGDRQPAHVSFMVFGDPAELAAYETLVAAFHETEPAIQIGLRHIPSQGEYRQRLATDFTAGAPPDVMLLNYRRFSAFAAQGGLAPLGPYLESSASLQRQDFFPQALAAFELEGQLWCLPQNLSSLVVYFNQDLFDAAGLSYPSPGWTQADFLAAARQLTRDFDGDGRFDQYGAGIEPTLFRLAPFVWANLGEIVDDPAAPSHLNLDSPAALEALTWFVNLQTREQVVPDAIAEAAEGSESRFLNGRLALYFNSRRGVPTYRESAAFRWDVAPLPAGRQSAGILHSDGYCLAARAVNKTAAWAFIEYANSVTGQTLVARSGRTVPSLRAVAESPAFLAPDQPPAASAIFIATVPQLRRVPLMTTWAAIEETASAEIERAFYGRASVAEAAAAARERTQPFFDQTARGGP